MNILDKLRFHLRSHCDTLSDGWVVGCVQLVIKTKNFHYTKIFLMEETTWRRSYLSCNEHSSRMVNIPFCIFCFYIIWISFTWNKIHTKRRNLVVDVSGLILVSAEHEKTYGSYGLYYSASKKATAMVFIWGDRGHPAVRFEYNTAYERYLVAGL